MKYYAADVAPAITALGKLFVLLARISGQNGLAVAACVLAVLAVVVSAVWYVQRMSNGDKALPPTAFQVAPQEARPVARVQADDGYFKKCAACGKFTRDAKVCRSCGRELD